VPFCLTEFEKILKISLKKVNFSLKNLKNTTANTDLLESFKAEDFAGFTITPSDAKYFGEPNRPTVLVNKGGSLSTSATDVWGLICNKSDTEYASIVYVDKNVTVKGVSPEHDGTIDIMDITAGAGWNFVFISKVGKYNVFTVSKRIPASYKWTVIDFNFPLDLGGGGGH